MTARAIVAVIVALTAPVLVAAGDAGGVATTTVTTTTAAPRSDAGSEAPGDAPRDLSGDATHGHDLDAGPAPRDAGLESPEAAAATDAGSSTTTTSAPRPPAPVRTTTQAPMLVVPLPAFPGTAPAATSVSRTDEGTAALWRLAQRLVPVLQDETAESGWVLAIGCGLVLALLAGLRRVRRKLPAQGVLPAVARWIHNLARAAALLLVLALVPRVLPASLAPLLPWVLVAAAVSLGWSLRELMADVLGGVVLAIESRVQPGSWIACAGHEGRVERRSLRAVWLRDDVGRTVVVPNRLLLQHPLSTHADRGVLHEVTVRIGGTHSPEVTRRALVDAVLSSPWVRPGAHPTVHRDGLDGDVWRVRACLIDPSFAASLDGDLRERAEAVLASATRAGSDG